MQDARLRILRLSLRQLLLLFAIAALAMASLKFANRAWFAVVAGLAMACLFVEAVIAAVDRGPRQAFAIGFTVVMLGYGLIILTAERSSAPVPMGTNVELGMSSGNLPTTLLLTYAYKGVRHTEWIDRDTGKVVPNYDPSTAPASAIRSKLGANSPPVFASVFSRQTPPIESFMRIGHCWWALLLGYAGGQFARYVHFRRIDETQKPAADFS